MTSPRRMTLPCALLLAVALAYPARSQEHGGGHGSGGGSAPSSTTTSARIGFDSVSPSRLDIVSGEAVTWTNIAARVHTVTADDGSFDSGRIPGSDTYTRRFAAAGEYAYHCSLHPSIRGVVAAHDLLLAVPGQHAASGKPFPLAGRSALPAGTPITIESDAGAGFRPVAESLTGDDGAFAARVVPQATARYRAVGGGITSAPVQLIVENHTISLRAQRMRGGHVRLRATVTPRPPGGRVVLQVYLPERFGWWPVRTARIGRSSTVTFMLHGHRRLRARARYTLADGATTLATSRVVQTAPPRARHHR